VLEGEEGAEADGEGRGLGAEALAEGGDGGGCHFERVGGCPVSTEILEGKGRMLRFKWSWVCIPVSWEESRISWSSRLFEHRGVDFFLEGQMEKITIRFGFGRCINPNPGNGLEHLDGHQLMKMILIFQPT
jgi:hypothetical protein